MRRALYRAPCTLGTSPLGAVSCAYSTWSKLPPGMKSAFTPAQYKKLRRAMPNWERDFGDMPKSKIAEALVDVGFSRGNASRMYPTVYRHIDDVAEKSNVKILPVTSTRSPSSFYGREEAIEMATKYITDVVTVKDGGYNAIDPNTGTHVQKFVVLASSGVSGIGKTEFLLHIAHHRLGKIGKKLKKKLVPLYLSFSGRKPNATLFTKHATYHIGTATPAQHHLEHAFAHVVLKSCGATVGIDDATSLSKALAYLREASGFATNEVIVLLVDDIGELGNPWAVDTIKAVMSCVDAARGKLVALFTHIDQEVLNTGARLSGRGVKQLPLPPLDLHAWEHLPMAEDKPMKYWAAANSGLHQLLMSLSGHPRSIFDDLPTVLRLSPWLLTSDMYSDFRDARYRIEKSRFNYTTVRYLGELVPKWLANQPVDTHQLSRDGLLQQLPSASGTVQFLFPLMVTAWAQKNRGSDPVANHAAIVIHADTPLGFRSELVMGSVLLHYEAAKRAAHGAERLTLGKYYGEVKCMNRVLKNTVVRCDPPQDGSRHVFNAKSFDDDNIMAEVFNRLRRGFIAEGSLSGGVQYLVPFTDDSTGAMLVACVKCCFVDEDVEWAKVDRKLSTAITRFRKLPNTKDITFFPVVYTTADREAVPKSKKRAAKGIYFVEEELFRFTSRLGILRLHIVKLGKITKKKYFPLFNE